HAPQPVGGALMLGVSVAGLIANAVAARMLHPSNKGSMNVRGAYLHVLGDLLASGGTIVAALVIRFTGWLQADPIASLLTTALIVRGSWTLVREAVDVLLESTPSHIALSDVRSALEAISGVESVHDLHVWSVTADVVALSAHLSVRGASEQAVQYGWLGVMLRKMGSEHGTVQLEQRAGFEHEALRPP